MLSQSTISKRIAGAVLSALLFSGAALAQDSTYTDGSVFESDILSETNIYRVRHQSVAATWNDSMASAAATYASVCNFTHPPLYMQGSNLAAGFSNPIEVVDAWYDEVSNPGYDFSTPGPQEGTLHFTQLVWNASTQIGCGAYYCNGTNSVPGWYTVCYYYPEGNVVLYGNEGYYFQRNVFPPVVGTSTSSVSIVSSTTPPAVSPTSGVSSSAVTTTDSVGSTITSAALVPSSNPIASNAPTGSATASLSPIYSLTNSSSFIVGTSTIVGPTSQTVINPTGPTTISVDGVVVAVNPANTHMTLLDGILTGSAAQAAVASAMGATALPTALINELNVASVINAVTAAISIPDPISINLLNPTAISNGSSTIIDGELTTTTASSATATADPIIDAALTTTTGAPICTAAPVQYVMLGQGVINLLMPGETVNVTARAFNG